jgi:hypothetical protein
MRFEVLTAVKMPILVFWFVKPYGLVSRCQRFGGRYFRPEDGGSMFFRNVDIYLQVYGVTTQNTNIDDDIVP